MYYEDGEIDLPTIKDEIGNAGYDGATGLASFDSSQFSISNDGTVTIIGGSAGLDTAQLKTYLDSNKYTTETWVKEQGYASESSLYSLQTKVNNFLEGSDTDTIINKWKELEVFLSGLSESDNLATILSTKWTTDNNLINQWNTAYGWGDHSKVGYALKSYVDKTFVTIAGNEDVTGVHDFVNGLKIGNIKLSKSQEGVVYLEGNLVVKGGVTMYALDEITVDSIIDSLPLASTSQYGIAKFNPSNFIINEDGFVTIIGGSSGLDTEELAEYLAINKYATQGWVEGKGYITSSALNGYATQSWVTNQKYITGITSAMVVSALGFTPYNSANFTKANIKSTLGISDWALATSKPSYAFSEIGTKPTTVAGYGITDAYTIQQADALYAKYLPLTGGTLSGNLVLKSATASKDTPKIVFQRGTSTDDYHDSYILNIGGTITFGISYNGTNYNRIQIGNSSIRPANSNPYAIGSDELRFSNVYSVLGNYSGEVSMQSANINGGKITYDATNKYFKLEGDLLVTGGVSMYSDDSAFTPSTIMDGVVVDGTSIRKNPTTGALEVIGGSGATVKYPLSWSGFNQGSYDGSVAQSFYIPTKLSEFVNDKSFATTSDLSGYLPLSGGELFTPSFSVLTLKRKNNSASSGIALTFANSNTNDICSIFAIESTRYLYRNDTVKNYKIWDEGNDGAGSGLDADLLDGLDSSVFARNKYINNFITSDNKFNFVPSGYTNSIWFNYQTQGGLNGNITTYLFGNGAGSTNNVILNATTFTGNSASATKLKTARTIWGQSFDGTGDIAKTTVGTMGWLYFRNASDDGNDGYVGRGASGNNIELFAYNGNLHLGTGTTNRLSINSSGNVLIGTTTDSGYKLDVNGTIRSKGDIRILRALNNDAYLNISVSDVRVVYEANDTDGYAHHIFQSNGTARLVINGQSGNVGIGITGYVPSYKLDVIGTVHSSLAFDLPYSTGDGAGITFQGKTVLRASNGGTILSSPLGGTHAIYIRPNGTTDSSFQSLFNESGGLDLAGRLTINGIPIYKSQNDVLYIGGNLVVRGGVTMYAENEVDIPSIIDSLPIANANTQDNASKGIASFDSAYFKVTDGWVTLTSTIGSLQDVSSSVSGTTNSDVVLFKSANSNTWTTKPLSEIGGGGSVSGNYLPLSGGTITSSAITPLLVKGTHSAKVVTIRLANIDRSVADFGHSSEDGAYMQDFVSGNYIGVKTDGTPYFWNESYKTLIHSENYSSYALPLSGGTLDGALTIHGKKEWSIYAETSASNVCASHIGGYGMYIGTSSSSSSVYALRVGGSLTGASNIFFTVNANGNVGIGTTNPAYKLDVDGNVLAGYFNFKKQDGSGENAGYIGLPSSDLYDIAIVSTTASPIKIITGDYINPRMIINPDGKVGIGTTSPSEILDVVGYVKASDGYNLANTTDSYCGLVAARRVTNSGDARDIWLYNNHKIWIYGDTGVTVATDLLVSGGITMYSDIRKKTKLQDVELSLSQIANAPLIQHYYNSDQNKTTHVGSIAQYWAGLNDWFCKLDNEGYYTMEIQNCALASAISIARHLGKYESKTDKKIRMLKNRVKELEDKLERLEGGNYGC